MKPVAVHSPGLPRDEAPPQRLLDLAEHLHEVPVVQAGVTTTADGRWALFVTVPADTEVPLPAVEQAAAGFPVVYEAQAASPPVARPAFPRRRR